MPVSTRLPSGSLLPVLLLLALPASWRNARGDEPTAPDWVKAADAVAFQARDSSGELVFRDRLWILGGWFSSHAEPPRDVWSSADGVRWERVLERAPWRHADLPTSLVFDDRMWMMGGWHLGRLPGASGGDEVWFSRDGAGMGAGNQPRRLDASPGSGRRGVQRQNVDSGWFRAVFLWDRQEPPQRCLVLQRRQGVERGDGGRPLAATGLSCGVGV